MIDSNTNESIQKPFHEKVFTEKTGVILSFISLGILLIGIYIFAHYGSWQKNVAIDESKIAQFGDFIGGIVGTLVAFVGIILYYVALTEQRNDIRINQGALNLQITALNHQTVEFQAQKEELISTRKIYEQQTKTMKNQQFDSNFYSLLNVYVSTKNNLNESNGNHDFFNSVYDEFNQLIPDSTADNFNETNQKIIENYTNIYFKYRGRLSSYFKTIYRLLKFIEDCDHLKEEEKIFYSKIVRSQISDNELLLLYYNYHSIYGNKAQQVVLKYRLLKHIQRLSKIEFVKHFNFQEENEKNRITIFTEWLIELMENNINKAKNIETTDPTKTEEAYKEYNVIVGIYIDEKFELKIIAKKETISNLPFGEDEFLNFIDLVLHDYYFYEKFRKIKPNEITKLITKRTDTITFEYTIENL
ncbi:putative phage abortive infection protein [Flavobacterium undicola]|uniref:putative phage abortive infection protein n=1 Tax=Flavobacterium undicola TaxID=1932779 RepID=UPI00137780C1|nr:putative phage abortive infection protein [Flavobacterium undicola]MBA0884945.1 putative phage abortive infection protein [Flavobacterium undicola]